MRPHRVEIIITVVRGTPEPFDVSIIRDTIKRPPSGRVVGKPWSCASPRQRPDHQRHAEELDKGSKELGGSITEGVVLTCATIPAAFEEAITVSTLSSTRARSSRPAVGRRAAASVTMPKRAT
jgi:hypothetical protein